MNLSRFFRDSSTILIYLFVYTTRNYLSFRKCPYFASFLLLKTDLNKKATILAAKLDKNRPYSCQTY